MIGAMKSNRYRSNIMHFVINVAKNGQHFFATAEHSITTPEKCKEVHSELKRVFPVQDGYNITCVQHPTHWGHYIDPEDL